MTTTESTLTVEPAELCAKLRNSPPSADESSSNSANVPRVVTSAGNMMIAPLEDAFGMWQPVDGFVLGSQMPSGASVYAHAKNGESFATNDTILHHNARFRQPSISYQNTNGMLSEKTPTPMKINANAGLGGASAAKLSSSSLTPPLSRRESATSKVSAISTGFDWLTNGAYNNPTFFDHFVANQPEMDFAAQQNSNETLNAQIITDAPMYSHRYELGPQDIFFAQQQLSRKADLQQNLAGLLSHQHNNNNFNSVCDSFGQNGFMSLQQQHPGLKNNTSHLNPQNALKPFMQHEYDISAAVREAMFGVGSSVDGVYRAGAISNGSAFDSCGDFQILDRDANLTGYYTPMSNAKSLSAASTACTSSAKPVFAEHSALNTGMAKIKTPRQQRALALPLKDLQQEMIPHAQKMKKGHVTKIKTARTLSMEQNYDDLTKISSKTEKYIVRKRDPERMMRNRISAMKSRQRSKEYLNSLELRAQKLKDENTNLKLQIANLMANNAVLQK